MTPKPAWARNLLRPLPRSIQEHNQAMSIKQGCPASAAGDILSSEAGSSFNEADRIILDLACSLVEIDNKT